MYPAEELRKIVISSISSLCNEQKNVFDSILNEIFPGVTSSDPFHPFENVSSLPPKPRTFFLDASGELGKRLNRAIQTLNLTQNMRLQALTNDPTADSAARLYPRFLLSLGEGRLPEDESGNIQLAGIIRTTESSDELIECVYSDIEKRYNEPGWMISRAILCATNSSAQNSQRGDWIMHSRFSEDSEECRLCYFR